MRLLQQTLRSSQFEQYLAGSPTAVSTPGQDSSLEPGPGGDQERAQAQALFQEREEQIKALCGHLERLGLEKDSLQQELKSLKIKVGEINDQLGMLMETIQAKDEVIIKLSQQSGEGWDGSPEGSSPPPNKDQQELHNLKVNTALLSTHESIHALILNITR